MSGNDETFMSYCLELNDDLLKVYICFFIVLLLLYNRLLKDTTY